MSLTMKQVSALKRSLNPAYVRTREINGRELSYVEGWHVISEANRIFGFDAWDRETIEPRCIQAKEVRGNFIAIYVAKVRITVHVGDHRVVREGHGCGEGRGTTLAECHDMALKVAETDATKRALATFGKPFGLSLYVSSKQTAASRPRRLSSPPLQPANQVAGEPHEETRLDATLVHVPAQSVEDVRESATISQDVPAMISADVEGGLLKFGAPRRYRNKQHLRYVASQPCLICGRQPSDAHHLRFTQPRGLGLKSSDEFTVPLCRIHHRQLHQGGKEVDWWNDMDVDPVPIAAGLWQETLALKDGSKPQARSDLPNLDPAP